MRIYLKTSLTPEIELYDIRNPVGIGGGTWVQDLLSPVVIVRDDDGSDLYVYGNYQASSLGAFLILGVAFLLILKILK